MTVPSNKAMPLRIALLAQPANAAGLSVDLLSELPSIQKIALGDNFNLSINNAIEAVTQGHVVELTTPSSNGVMANRILMLNALSAAKSKIHPHAYFAGFSENNATKSESIAKALLQARRLPEDLSYERTFNLTTPAQQFAELFGLVTALSGRTLANRYWFTQQNKARVASITFNSECEDSTSLILTQATGLQPAKPLLSKERVMFVVSGANESELKSALAQLKVQLSKLPVIGSSDLQAIELIELMHSNLKQYQTSGSKIPACADIVIQAASVESAIKEIAALENSLGKVMAENSHYKTPSGSCFSPAPNSKGGVTFVYPGVGTVYPGLLREFHHYFPQLFARLEREGDLEEMLQASKTYADEPQELSLSELAIAGVGSSYILTQLLCENFAVQPDFALGYSKGEASMWASLGVWKNPHALIEMTQTSPIFTTAISGKLTAVRKNWQLSATEQIEWNSFVVRSDAAAIKALLPEFPRAYLAIIQGDTCVLAGCEETCRALLKKLGKRGIPANRVTAMHTTPAWSQHEQIREFYTQPVFDELPEHIRFISAAENRPVDIDSQSIARSIADTFCSTLDFTSLIRSARKQGAHLFIEVGADRQTSTLIDKINRTDEVANEYCTVATNAKGGEDIMTLLKCIGQLITHQIPLSVTPLIEGLEQQMNRAKYQHGLAKSETLSVSGNKTNNHQGEPV
ncbi:PfaB family protein [Vibrio genomosp. F10 str. 9ZC157]|uniref:Omega-3 polyunsaturated fatty acid synthase PfaB n=1 Tax=Vibrio genomosp. F10 str. ZF-129 TaxID=1187848 RepID=A0A1E5BBD5_9VIBR|nr:PfaB family protein [Vibrio genomosp. F10]OEE31430.1 omega-3 polyunsaturated fatty acid synthase PfaB [Vibrio genomosp. F10 str. ZF-129]OEE93641.1 omega-3 polyunsaturated fatty acid synthase PfaB [Vibrio genomosp. F10 str. 9ZC157]